MRVHVSFQRIFPDGTILAPLSIAQEVSFVTMYLLMATVVRHRIESFSAILIIARVLFGIGLPN
jgi:hypothetical protein